MCQMKKVGKVHTTIMQHDDTVTVCYHETDVVKFDKKSIILNAGKWFTKTTKTRMNQTAKQFGLDYFVFPYKGSWRVLINGAIVPFTNNMIITR